MMHAPIDTYRFVAAPFHVDFMQKLSMGVLGKHLLNCADSYASDRGFDVAVQHGEHYTWVLSRLAIEWEDMPRQHEEFCIQTWIEKIYRLFADRNFAILDKDGKPIGHVRSVWAMISMETRTPADLLALHGEKIASSVCDKECPIGKPGRVKVTTESPVAVHRVRYSDLDINGHTNSIKYIEHILDLFPLEVFKEKALKRFEIAYVAESYYGDTLSFFIEEKSSEEFDVEIRKSSNEVVVRSKVIFK